MNIAFRSVASLVLMVAVLILLDVLGVFTLSIAALLTFFMMLTGFLVYAHAFGRHRPVISGTAAGIFLLGLLLFLQNVFAFSLEGREYITALLLIAGLVGFLLFVEDTDKRYFMSIGLLFTLTALFLLFRGSEFSFAMLWFWTVEILKKTWAVFLLLFLYLAYMIKR